MLPTLIDDPKWWKNRIMSPEEALGWFDMVCDAVWMHDGRPESPHAESPHNGKCIGGFFDCSRVLCYPNLCEIFALQLVRKLKEAGIEKVDWIISSFSANFSREVAKGFDANYIFIEETIPKGATVLQVEEIIDNKDGFQEARRAVTERNSNPINLLPVVGALVHCAPKIPTSYNGVEVVSLLEAEVWEVDPPCRFCNIGSPRYLPAGNWPKLTGKV